MKNRILLGLSLVSNLALIVLYACNADETASPEVQERLGFSKYHYRRTSIFETLPNRPGEIIFLGNSITDSAEWAELFGNPKVINRGISADRVESIIDRIDEVVESEPAKIFLMIGTNDQRFYEKDTVLADYQKLVNIIRAKSPETKLFIQSILPVLNDKYRKNEDILYLNEGIKKIATDAGVPYIDLHKVFATGANELKADLTGDGLHLNGKGYLLWKEQIEHLVNE